MAKIQKRGQGIEEENMGILGPLGLSKLFDRDGRHLPERIEDMEFTITEIPRIPPITRVLRVTSVDPSLKRLKEREERKKKRGKRKPPPPKDQVTSRTWQR